MNNRIDLSPDDIHDLCELIDHRLRDLRIEIVHTEQRAFRASLREAVERLEDLERRVHHLAADLPARAEPSAIAVRPAN